MFSSLRIYVNLLKIKNIPSGKNKQTNKHSINFDMMAPVAIMGYGRFMQWKLSKHKTLYAGREESFQ